MALQGTKHCIISIKYIRETTPPPDITIHQTIRLTSNKRVVINQENLIHNQPRKVSWASSKNGPKQFFFFKWLFVVLMRPGEIIFLPQCHALGPFFFFALALITVLYAVSPLGTDSQSSRHRYGIEHHHIKAPHSSMLILGHFNRYQ